MIKHQIKHNRRFYILLIFVFLSFLPFTIVSFIYTFKNEYVNIISLGVFLFFCFSLFYIIFSILNSSYIIEIHENYIVLKKFFGIINQTIYFSEFKNWSEYNSPYYSKLNIYTIKDKFSIYSNEYNQYEIIKKVVLENATDKSFVDNLKFKRLSKNILIIFMSILIIFAILFLIFHKTEKQIISKNTLSEVSGQIDTIYVTKDKNGSRLYLKLLEFNELEFVIFDQVFYKIDEKILVTINKNDTVSLLIDNIDYNGKILKTIELGFWKKHLEYEKISVFELKTKKGYLITLKDINNELLADNDDNILFFVISGLIIISCSIILFLTIKKKITLTYNSRQCK